jgi:hypothetical protein
MSAYAHAPTVRKPPLRQAISLSRTHPRCVRTARPRQAISRSFTHPQVGSPHLNSAEDTLRVLQRIHLHESNLTGVGDSEQVHRAVWRYRIVSNCPIGVPMAVFVNWILSDPLHPPRPQQSIVGPFVRQVISGKVVECDGAAAPFRSDCDINSALPVVHCLDNRRPIYRNNVQVYRRSCNMIR